jgi:hypothetical protein
MPFLLWCLLELNDLECCHCQQFPWAMLYPLFWIAKLLSRNLLASNHALPTVNLKKETGEGWVKKCSKLIALIICATVTINYKQHVKASDRIDLYLFGWLI